MPSLEIRNFAIEIGDFLAKCLHNPINALCVSACPALSDEIKASFFSGVLRLLVVLSFLFDGGYMNACGFQSSQMDRSKLLFGDN
mmetsp:Transcript_7557/g.19782  ORF Transcript_7557/g.19782 Transcript_7557/m.19782 type:complete len:85 (+) Transcript_7557:199-453(+)